MPVRCLAPTFFRYPAATPSPKPRWELLHVGSLAPITHAAVSWCSVTEKTNVPFRHTTTANAEEAARLYAQHGLVLNVPLNHDLNHRLFEVMAAGVPQVIFGHPSLLGDHSPLSNRPDLFWVQSIEELENVVEQLFSDPIWRRTRSVEGPPYWDLKALLKQALAP